MLPVAPMQTKLILRFYGLKTNWFKNILAKLMVIYFSNQIHNDKVIWDDELFLGKRSILSQKDDWLVKYRRWYSKFYSYYVIFN